MEYKPFRNESVNHATNVVDAVLFVDEPTLIEIEEIERLCRRWTKECYKLRNMIAHQTGEDLV